MTAAPEPDDRRAIPSASAARSLRRLRLRVTAWYVATFAAVLVALGALLFVALAHDVSADLDASLRAATKEVAGAADRREQERAATSGGAIDAVAELRIPDRQLYLFDVTGNPLTPAVADSVIRRVAVRAGRAGTADERWEAPHDQSLQAHAERFSTRGGTVFVAAAVAHRDEIDERYATLFALFGTLGALGLVLVASGGWLLARKSVVPVEVAMEHMRRFMADAAHELRTPVAVIRSRVDVTLERPREAREYERMLAELRDEIERLATLVTDLFTLARADAGERAFAFHPVQLDEVVLESVSAAGWMAARRDIALRVDDSDEAVVSGDATLLRQLVMILLDNAIKFGDSGGAVKISVRANDGAPTLVVEDDGAGIAPGDAAHVFDRFYRGEATRASTSGAGLGLAIAQWIAEAHGARVILSPAATRGTVATVVFPAAAPH